MGKYLSKRFVIEAEQITPENFKNLGVTEKQIGDYVINESTGLSHIMLRAEFERKYEHASKSGHTTGY